VDRRGPGLYVASDAALSESEMQAAASCFKYRHKIELDVAIEGPRDYLRAYRGSVDELWRYATVCRVTSVMRPYLEALSA